MARTGRREVPDDTSSSPRDAHNNPTMRILASSQASVEGASSAQRANPRQGSGEGASFQASVDAPGEQVGHLLGLAAVEGTNQTAAPPPGTAAALQVDSGAGISSMACDGVHGRGMERPATAREEADWRRHGQARVEKDGEACDDAHGEG
jgi:hypothetical protein